MISLPTIISNYIQFNFWGIAMNILLTRRYSRLKTFLLFQLIILGMIFSRIFCRTSPYGAP